MLFINLNINQIDVTCKHTVRYFLNFFSKTGTNLKKWTLYTNERPANRGRFFEINKPLIYTLIIQENISCQLSKT